MERAPISSGREWVAFRRLLWVGPLAAVLAVVANALVWALAVAVGWIRLDFLLPGPDQPLTLPPVIMATIIGAVGAIVAFVLIGRFTARPARAFVIAAVVALVLSFATPLTIPGAPLGLVLALELMHVVAAVVIVGVLIRFGVERG